MQRQMLGSHVFKQCCFFLGKEHLHHMILTHGREGYGTSGISGCTCLNLLAGSAHQALLVARACTCLQDFLMRHLWLHLRLNLRAGLHQQALSAALACILLAGLHAPRAAQLHGGADDGA
jgi:hypothetical protein